MRRIFKNWKLKVLALIGAVVFWIFIIGIQTTFHQLPEEIPVQPFNLATELSIMNDLGSVKLIVNTDKETLKTLTAKDFTAYVDLQGMGVGESMADILVTSKNSSATVLKIDPDQIKVIIEEVATKNIPLKHALKGRPKEGYEVGTVELSKEEIKIKGAKSVIQEAVEAVAAFSLDGTEIGDVIKKGSIKAVDINENEIKNIQIEEGNVEAEIEIKQISEKKTVGIEPSFIGALSEGWIEKITLNPQTVTIKGDPVTLSKIEAIKTEKIDLRTISGTSSIKAQLKLPNNVSAEDGVKEVTLTLEIETQEK